MRTTLVALLFSIVLVVGSAAHVNDQYGIFWDPVGIALVLGGTIVVAFVTFPAKEVMGLLKSSAAIMRMPVDHGRELAVEIISLARDTRGEPAELQGAMARVRNPFLMDGVSLLVDRLEPSRIESILKDRIKIKQESDETSANMWRTLAKYPPSLGIIGTVLGLIALMLQLGSANGAEKMGPAMAIGLVATLYGLVLTNFFLQPIGDNIALRSYREIRRRQMVLLGIVLLAQGEKAVVVQEAVNSLLPVAERVDVLGIGGGSGSDARANESARGVA
jgi:chemotaxis protein MotA